MGSLAAYFRLVRENRNFRRLWFAQIISEIGDWFYSLAVYSLILDLTGSARLVGLAVVVQVLPQTLAAPTVGVGSDRISRKRVSGMRFEEPHADASRPLRGRDLIDFSPILEGVRYVRRDPKLLATLFVKGGLGFLGANLVILPLLGARVFPLQLHGIDAQRAAM